MKKIFILILIVVVFIPSITFASWWNPFTWKVFNRSSEIKIEKSITPPINSVDTSNQTTKEESKKLDESAEIEKLKKEVEGLKKKTSPIVPTPKPVISNTIESKPQIQNPILPIQENSALKIAKCEAKRDSLFSAFTVLTNKTTEEGIDKLNEMYQTKRDEVLDSYYTCMKGDYVPCSSILKKDTFYKNYYQNLINDAKKNQESALIKGKAITDGEYSKCLNE